MTINKRFKKGDLVEFVGPDSAAGVRLYVQTDLMTAKGDDREVSLTVSKGSYILQTSLCTLRYDNDTCFLKLVED